MPISSTNTMPIQYAEKLPAVRPARTLSDAPPSRDAVTTSRTWPEFVDVKTLTTSGMMAPASVPQLMIAESCHHKEPLPRSRMSRYEATKVIATETIEVSQTRIVSGCSKFILSAFLYLAVAIVSLTR